MLREEFSGFKNFVFDLDGTVWYWDVLVPGAREAIEAVAAAGKEIYFVTNNSMLSPEGFVRKLGELGIITEFYRITSSPEIIVRYLKDRSAKKIFCLSFRDTTDYFMEEGLEISEDPDFVVITYHKSEEENVRKAADLVSRGIPAITNATGKVWALKGRRLPGVGIFVEKIEKLSGNRVKIVGKPSDFSVEYVREKYGLKPEETIFFGDSLNSDMKFARKLGWSFAFVLTGEYRREDLEKWGKPDFVLENLKGILK